MSWNSTRLSPFGTSAKSTSINSVKVYHSVDAHEDYDETTSFLANSNSKPTLAERIFPADNHDDQPPILHSMTATHNDHKIGPFSIWAIGVGSGLGGVFFGWQFILYGGFYYALIALIMAAYFYWIYAHFITELAIRYHCSGGSFDFVARALGTRASIAVAILSIIKLIAANAATALAVSSYLSEGGGATSTIWSYCIWILLYGGFTLCDCYGVKESSTLQMFVTAICIALVIFVVGVNFAMFDVNNLQQSSVGVPAIYKWYGMYSFLKGIPFALQFFDGFEEVPLLMSYAKDPEITIPYGIKLCYGTILTIAITVLISCTSAVDKSTLLESESPLLVGIEAYFGKESVVTYIVAYLVVLGLVVNFFAFVLFSSQQIQAISQSKLLPSILGYRHANSGAPIYASILSMIIGFTTTIAFSSLLGDDDAQDTLLIVAIVPTVLTYVFVLQCIVRIRDTELDARGKGKYGYGISSSSSSLSSTAAGRVPISKKKPASDTSIHGAHSPMARFLEDDEDYVASFPQTLRERVLGDDPKELYVSNGRGQARLSQVLCIFIIIGIICLSVTSFNYVYGMVVSFSLATLGYMVMITKAKQEMLLSEDRYGLSETVGTRSASSTGDYSSSGVDGDDEFDDISSLASSNLSGTRNPLAFHS